MKTSLEINEVVSALVAARKEFAAVLKSSTGQVGQNRAYRYADMVATLGAIDDPLLKHGLVLSQSVSAAESCVITRLMHTSGQWLEDDGYPLAINASMRPQEIGSATTYSRRYGLSAFLCLAAEDDDGHSAQQAEAPRTTQAPTASTQTISQRDRFERNFTPSAEPVRQSHANVYVRDVKAEQKPKKDGGTFTKYTVVFSDGTVAGTAKTALADAARQAMTDGHPVKFTTKTFGRSLDLETFYVVPGQTQDDGPPLDSYDEPTQFVAPF